MNAIDSLAGLQYRNLKLKPPAAKGDNDKLKKACEDFSSIFIKQMLNSMKKTVHKSGLMDGGMAEEIFEDMLYDEYAKKIASTANLGLADMMYRQLSK
ncbi:MAG: rod-binding protein [Spirochaetales bacterium]|nr:rod-binding protein [Spirochaetales bacterium]